jgi:hypothetical protein
MSNEQSLNELLGIDDNEPASVFAHREMCPCGVLPSPCGCETVELESRKESR